MKGEQKKDNLSGVIYTNENSQDNQSESKDYFSVPKFSDLFGDDEYSGKKKNVRNIIIIIVCVLLTYIILSSYFSKEPIIKKKATSAIAEETLN